MITLQDFNEVGAELCDQAAIAIETRGHAKAQYELPTGEVCAVGAAKTSPLFNRVHDVDGYPRWLGWDVIGRVARQVGTHNLPSWNDDPSRTADEVVAAFRDTAAALRSQSLVDEPATVVAVFDPRWVIGAPEGAVRTVVEVVS